LKLTSDGGGHPLFAEVLVEGAVVTWYIDDIGITTKELSRNHQRYQPYIWIDSP
jgi:hypothetical protein